MRPDLRCERKCERFLQGTTTCHVGTPTSERAPPGSPLACGPGPLHPRRLRKEPMYCLGSLDTTKAPRTAPSARPWASGLPKRRRHPQGKDALGMRGARRGVRENTELNDDSYPLSTFDEPVMSIESRYPRCCVGCRCSG